MSLESSKSRFKRSRGDLSNVWEQKCFESWPKPAKTEISDNAPLYQRFRA